MSGPTLTLPSAVTSMPGKRPQESAIGLLPQREHNRIGLERFVLAGGLRTALSVEIHNFYRKTASGDLFDTGQPLDSNSFLDRLIRLEGVCRHMRAIAAIDDQRLVGAQAPYRARRIHRRVSRSVDHHSAAQTRRFPRLDVPQERHGIQHAHRVSRRNIHMLADARADGDEDRIKMSR